jgi:hypothetical protein
LNHLIGRVLPDIELQSTAGKMINPARLEGTCVFFCYPINVPENDAAETLQLFENLAHWSKKVSN